MHAGWYSQAAVSLQEALEATQRDGFRREEAFDLAITGCLMQVQGNLGQSLMDLEEAVSSFRQMGFAGELGMALGGLALAQHSLRQEEQAWASLQEAMMIAVKTHSRFTLFLLPAALVVLLSDAGRWELAIEAYSAAMADPIPANSRWFADMVGNRMDLAGEHLPEEVRQAAVERGREGDVFDVLSKVSQEIESWGTSQPTSSLN
jgi:tetratricopeptide (TPR) repeat protein